MNAAALLRAVAPASRAPQDYIAGEIEAFLDSGRRMLCVNAETGVGKTFAYAAPAVLAAGRGRKVVVSTHTTQQLDQVVGALRRLAAAAPDPVAVARRLGRANFLSPGRIARVLANRRDLDEDDRALLKAARAHAGPIDDFESGHGALPVPRADVCLTASCSGQSAYDAQREEAGAAAIVAQTHAMSILDAVRGAVDADIAIYDEGDALPAAAAGFAESRVTPLDLAAAEHRGDLPRLGGAVSAFEEWAAGAVGAGKAVFKQHAPEAAEHARAIRAALEGPEDEHLRDMRRALARFARLDPARPWRGAAVAAAPGGHVFQVLALDPARVLQRTYEGRQTLFVSATLAVGAGEDAPDYAPFLRSVGGEARGAAGPRVAIEDFGAMTFVLADRRAPLPFEKDDDRTRDPAFDDHAARIVRAAMAEGGRALVLAASFADVEELAARTDGLLAHRRGEPLAACLERFVSDPRGALATPSAWAGTDLPGMIDHVVILRAPFPPPDSARAELLRRLLESRGCDGGAAQGVLMQRGRLDTVRRLAQGLGRGVRGPADRVKVWIADPRFPLPDALARDPRRSLGQRRVARHEDLAGAIPGRFIDAYERATIFPHEDRESR